MKKKINGNVNRISMWCLRCGSGPGGGGGGGGPAAGEVDLRIKGG